MKRVIIVILLLFSTFDLALAYPISPRPLRKLIMESEYILIAHVTDLRQEKKGRKKNSWIRDIAVLSVSEVLKGSYSESIIEIPFASGFICPAPPHFEKDTDVLVFLNKEENTYHVHALSYGVKTLSKADLAVYKSRINEMMEILKIEDKETQFLETVDWLVRCAEEPATRHEGTYELSRESDFMSFYDRSEDEPFEFMLNDEQVARLEAALLASSPAEPADLGLVDLVYHRQPEKVYTLMVDNLRHMNDTTYWMAGEYMQRILLFNPNKKLQALAGLYAEKNFDLRAEPEEILAIIKDFVKEIDQENRIVLH